MKLAAKIFLEDHQKLVLGPGRMELLKATESLGSLHKAAQAMGMSYRWAWGRLKTAEQELGVPLLTQEGEPGRGKTKILSAEARELLRWYAEIERQAAELLSASTRQCPAFLKMEPR
ncbi:MAG: LysR family transcriptional regulator [Candidatus Adiutrix sp.]|jgi:molybdate transport system regulatory protein|nr:LysR family transcriptional regulator [Candidatus Adiutrix sp.]